MLKRLTFSSIIFLLATSRSFAETITEYTIPTSSSAPANICTGPDGKLWFTESDGNKIGTTTVNGTITEYPLITAAAKPWGITTGPDGNLWFTMRDVDKIGMITTAGVITEFPLPDTGSEPYQITRGSDGNLWFTEKGLNRVGTITTAGVITEFPLPGSAVDPTGITQGPSSLIWYTESGSDRVGSITGAGSTTRYTLTTGAMPLEIVQGRDGNLWSTLNSANQIARVDTVGTINTYNVTTGASGPWGIADGPTGTWIWFTENTGNKIGQVTPGGACILETAIPTGASEPQGITRGPDDKLWFVESAGNKIGVLDPTNFLHLTSDTTLTAGVLGSSFSLNLAGTGGTAPYTFAVEENTGALPPGLSLSSTGAITGTPTEAGTFAFGVRLTDSCGLTFEKGFSLQIANADLPDLKPAIHRSTSKRDHRTTLTTRIYNRSLANAIGAFTLKIYRSRDKVLDANDKLVKSASYSELSATEATNPIRVRYSSRTRGYLIAVAEASFLESDSGNNSKTKRIN